jgi:hypothetical protein
MSRLRSRPGMIQLPEVHRVLDCEPHPLRLEGLWPAEG